MKMGMKWRRKNCFKPINLLFVSLACCHNCFHFFSDERTTRSQNKMVENNIIVTRDQRIEARNNIKEGGVGEKRPMNKVTGKGAKAIKAIIDLGYNEVFQMTDCWSWSDDGEG